MFIAERFISGVVKIHGKHPVPTDGGTWHPQACKFPRLKHNLHSLHEKSLIERTMQYIKDRTEGFDDYFPCRTINLRLKHHLHSSHEKSLIERTMQYIKDRTEGFDDYFPCRTINCKLKHVRNWLNLFVDYHNKELSR